MAIAELRIAAYNNRNARQLLAQLTVFGWQLGIRHGAYLIRYCCLSPLRNASHREIPASLAQIVLIEEDKKALSPVLSVPAGGVPCFSVFKPQLSLNMHAAEKEAFMQADIGLTAEQRQGVVALLGKLLADEYVLYTKTRNYHWNVVGPEFHTLHEFFEDQYKQLSERIDDIAERIRSLDFNAIGTLAECLEYTRLEESPGQYPVARTMVTNLVADHETILQQLRKDLETCEDQYHDIGTMDFLTDLMEQHEKMAWMLRAFIQADGVQK